MLTASIPDSPDNPALVYRRSTAHPRSSDVTGFDFTWIPLGDLEVTRSGDFAQTTGADLIVQALLRRLYTPPDGYRRWVRTPQGLQVVDVEYANEAYRYLSGPINSRTVNEMRDAIWACVQQERRIEPIRLFVQPSPVYMGRVEMELTYRIRGEQELQTLNYVLRVPEEES